ncbi:MAG: hypothetical protein COZ16_09070 [Flavobacteriaceae bacterium CG_4_10_14_3_um_filter_31_253]|nr:MAG: hypothetical protein AUK46_02200 [Flavobacteriaceae bacterium CG2_30_31_66]PIV96648.1 MAG: hypothetical protein COW43_07185 [Flavobacteriaceae bacterium CG17_big_fil_post_rev_8_21_14_2_50_31_13]PIX15270.1 MAG: hypothetical protein COZ74_00710 [Flavobacteriaceae bacterium CG_4_8_14_3_um_filter_31_8]PIY14445.1 MAG: hypothetical protein COZ16_09070 [Flavobacteriaceae bacterium CG_4_10_14_3_um_filter_31_253]PIZ10032.1 MAG: hypothetical protein COY55_09735 [Flavobacteriaceae bacterium CG_4_1
MNQSPKIQHKNMKKVIKKRTHHSLLFNLNIKMRITTLLLMISLFQLQANGTYAQKTLVSLDYENVSLETVFNKIESITDYKFVFKDKDVDYKKNVSIKATKEELSDVLKKLFANTKIGFSLNGKQIILIPKNQEVSISTNSIINTQQIKISGIIIDENKNPLPGASIVIKGTLKGTETDFNGKFILDVESETSIIVVSFLGYSNNEVVVGKETFFEIVLKEDSSQLEEIVVVGYGSQNIEKVANSVSTIKSKDLLSSPIASFEEGLAGQLTGVDVVQTSGNPGSYCSSKYGRFRLARNAVFPNRLYCENWR